jgi:hypothetical protein
MNLEHARAQVLTYAEELGRFLNAQATPHSTTWFDEINRARVNLDMASRNYSLALREEGKAAAR